MQLRLRSQQGLSLVELLVSVAISLTVLAAAVALLTANTQLGAKQLQQDHLQATLFRIGSTISHELSRAGFCFDCTKVNPFFEIFIDDSPSQLVGSCIRFSYNHDKRQHALVIGKDDAKGFRLGKNADGKAVIEIYENRKGLQNWHCNSKGGYAGYWQDMSLSNLTLEDFSFSRRLSTTDKGVISYFRLRISAAMTENSAIKADLSMDIYPTNG